MNTLLRIFFHRIVTRGTLEVVTSSGQRFAVGDGTGNPVAIRLIDRAAERRLLTNPALALGELYTDGQLTLLQGNLYDLLALVCSNLAWQPPPGLGTTRLGVRKMLRSLHQRNTRWRASRNVAHHYDLDGRLYGLFLDADRQYSCAYFERADQSLDEAQLAKKRHIAAKLLMGCDQRVLDIGSGWGGMAFYLAQYCDVRVTGITLSEEQLGVARKRARDRGLTERAEFNLQDYRTQAGRFDRIVSVGMFEHVGVSYYDTYFRKVSELLADDGVMLLHSIGRMDGPGATNTWIDKYIFPGGYAPALSEVLPAIERAGLIVTDVEILRLHYAETLKAWREKFIAQRDQVKALYDERFCRMWEFYLAASETAFRFGGLMVFQIQLAKRQDVVPLTRDYIGEHEALLREKEIAGANHRMLAAE